MRMCKWQTWEWTMQNIYQKKGSRDHIAAHTKRQRSFSPVVSAAVSVSINMITTTGPHMVTPWPPNHHLHCAELLPPHSVRKLHQRSGSFCVRQVKTTPTRTFVRLWLWVSVLRGQACGACVCVCVPHSFRPFPSCCTIKARPPPHSHLASPSGT